MKGQLTFVTLLILITSSVILPVISADEEPNDNIEKAECLDDSYVRGYVNVGSFEDLDFYRVSIPPSHDMEVTLFCQGGMVELVLVTENETKLESYRLTVDDKGEEKSLDYKGLKNTNEVIYIMVSGRGEYKLEVSYRRTGVSPKNDIDMDYIIFGSILILFVLIVLILVLLFRHINLNDEDDFEDEIIKRFQKNR